MNPDGRILAAQQITLRDSLANVLSKTKFQMCTHAIGGCANREILNIYNKYLQPGNDRRWRIEHAQIIHPDDFSKFGSAAIVPFSANQPMEPVDMYWATSQIGKERMKGAYAHKQLAAEWLAAIGN